MISASKKTVSEIIKRIFCLILILTTVISCGVYSFKDVSIPPQVKTMRLGFIENRARIVDPLLSPLLTDKLKQKISSQTKLIQITGDNADYDVTVYISDYAVSTAGVSNQTASINRLTVSVHVILKNRLADQKLGTPDFETDITRIFDFPATQNLNDAQASLEPAIVSQLTDDIFNRLFSNW
jgi:hypothetical protein